MVKYLRDASSRKSSEAYRMKHPEPYVPDFKKAVDYFSIQAGGRVVIDALQASLELSDEETVPQWGPAAATDAAADGWG